ncbi:MAG: ribonuclease Y [Rhodothermaceae bacterium]|nr:ribonuclease Y [Rhodothermaceae bacterium]
MDGSPAVLLLAVAIVAFCAGLVVTWWISAKTAKGKLRSAREQASAIITLAEKESSALRAEALKKARSELDHERAEFNAQRTTLEKEQAQLEQDKQRSRAKNDRQRKKLNNRNRRLTKRQKLLGDAAEAIALLQAESETINRQAETLRASADELVQQASQRIDGLDAKEHRLNSLIDDRIKKLEVIAGLTQDQALQHLREEIVEKAREEAALELLEIRDEKQRTAKHEAQKIVLTTMQRLVRDEVDSNSVSVVPVPSEGIKGRIIGREGRNLRAFETAAHVDLLIDDTPGAVVISSFDPYRREIARIALSNLIRDGRIHPASVEQFVSKAQKAVEEEIQEIGERTVLELRLRGMKKGLTSIVGKMKYRTSYGQSLLSHSVQVARLCSLMAAEMGLDARMARRAGLLHDIGKVLQESDDQPHALVGMEYCKRFKEHEQICNAVGSHHDEIEMTTLYAPIVQVCDAISGARPGARHIRREEYLERLRDMEGIPKSIEGVGLAYAIQGGRELRVIVQQNKISDKRTHELAEDISLRIQNELTYPGQVNVTVIREVRGQATAR